MSNLIYTQCLIQSHSQFQPEHLQVMEATAASGVPGPSEISSIGLGTAHSSWLRNLGPREPSVKEVASVEMALTKELKQSKHTSKCGGTSAVNSHIPKNSLKKLVRTRNKSKSE